MEFSTEFLLLRIIIVEKNRFSPQKRGISKQKSSLCPPRQVVQIVPVGQGGAISPCIVDESGRDKKRIDVGGGVPDDTSPAGNMSSGACGCGRLFYSESDEGVSLVHVCRHKRVTGHVVQKILSIVASNAIFRPSGYEMCSRRGKAFHPAWVSGQNVK